MKETYTSSEYFSVILAVESLTHDIESAYRLLLLADDSLADCCLGDEESIETTIILIEDVLRRLAKAQHLAAEEILSLPENPPYRKIKARIT